jgi:tripartite ATP-independent transporter DctM subunit
MEETLWPIIFATVLVLLFILIRTPIAISLGLSGIIGMWSMLGWEGMFESFKIYPYMSVASWELLPIPLFILMGYFAAAGGVTSAAFKTAYRWLGRFPGGLAHATIVACGLFAAACGSSTATAGTMGTVVTPEMLKYGYNKKLASGLVCAAGTFGVMIPPSMIFVIYGIITQNSIGQLLIAGIIPGILTLIFYSSAVYIIAKVRPDWAPRGEQFKLSEKVKSLKDIYGIFLLATCVVGGIYSGFFTPTEAAGVGASIAFLLGLKNGKLGLKNMLGSLADTASTTSMIFLLIVGSTFFSYYLSMSGGATWVSQTILNSSVHRGLILWLILVIYLPLGMIIDSVSLMLITLPVLYPVVESLGYNGIWFGVLQVKLNEIAMVTPPMGINLYVIKGVTPKEISFEDIVIGMLPFLICDILVLIILVFFPNISLFLPDLMK